MPFDTIVATYKAATPIYLGNESPSEPAQRLREASFKGVLRFWWRALFWQDYWEQAGQDEKRALALLKQAEGRLFGSASDNRTGQQALFHLRTYVESKGHKKDNPDPKKVGWKYLLGQGLDRRNPAFNAGSIFSVKLILKPRITGGQEEQLLKALVALGLFGGIGARSRRGVGSLCIQTLEPATLDLSKEAVPSGASDLPATFHWLGLPATCPMPPFTAFSKYSSVWAYIKNAPTSKLIDDYGYEFLQYRSYYDIDREKPKLSKPKKDPNFPEDHDEMLKAVKGLIPTKGPKRAIFGMPHNYFFKSEFEKFFSKFQNEGMERKKAAKLASSYAKASLIFSGGGDRRASPFLIHAHVFPKGNYAAVIQVLLPAPFPSDHLKVHTRRLRQPAEVSFDSQNWSTIKNFPEGLKGNRRILQHG